MRSVFMLLLLMFVAPASASAPAGEALGPGDVFPDFTASDQHGEAYAFEPGTRLVLIAFEMGAAKAGNKALAARPETYLAEHRAVYIANIHGMPGIGRRFAIPKMRKYPHRIILADEKDLLTPFPHQKDRVTVLELSCDGVITTVSYWNPREDALSLP